MVVMAAIAQGESEAKSESVKWGFQKRFEKGLPKLADLYGYTRDKRLLEIYEPEANVVRLIYQMFYDDKTIPEICYILNQQGIPSPRGGQWTYSTVKTILTNEKYSGDVLMQKTVTVDIFSHRSIRNDGRANQFFIQGYVLIPDCRFPNEIDYLKEAGLDTVNLRVVRKNFKSPLTPEQQVHPSETALDDVEPDYYITNNGSMTDLKRNVIDWLVEYLGSHQMTIDEL